ncbi:MAG: 1-deoxy-D-xylulose-5-phosphate reductoisomerase [Thermomicrobiales bacterium]|nr:1-deoxy-D-xylulose-5-phosphate reductoisomerase [Thermomicrobiales bacterium]
MTTISLLGSTGSIGTQTLEVMRSLPDMFSLVGLAGGLQTDLIAQQVAEFRPKHVVQGDTTTGSRPSAEQLIELATLPEADIIVIATNGHDAIAATIAALQAGKVVALANKEAIVCAGDLIMPLSELGTNLRPIDSEHSAVWQSLQSGKSTDLKRIILTASGGPFRTWSQDELVNVTPAQALKHPNWEMGAKITIDSATLMNKGLEVIEAAWLFDTPVNDVDVVIHPEQYIHSMVEFRDHSTIAQLSPPSMLLPIQYALTWPHHVNSSFRAMDFSMAFSMNFEPPRDDDFPCLGLARWAATHGGTYPTVLSAADEVAVDAFRKERIGFLDIPAVIQATMDLHQSSTVEHLDVVIEADHWARATTAKLITRFQRP